MKTMILRWMAVSPVIAIVLTVVGCASLSSNGVLTLKRTQIFVSWKMTAYQQAFTGGSVTEAQAQRVTAAHQAYEKAFQQAVTEAGGDLDAPTPPSLQAVVNQLIDAVENVLTTLS